MAITNHDPARARALPAGAVFHRCALQVNPHHYGGTFRGQVATGDVTTHARAIADKALALGISVLAVTDHNDVGSVPAFRAAAAGHALHVFPGFELSSSEGVHVLCLYPPDAEQDQLGRYLGAFGITDPNPSSDLSPMGLADILEKVREQGGGDRRCSRDQRPRWNAQGPEGAGPNSGVAERAPPRDPDSGSGRRSATGSSPNRREQKRGLPSKRRPRGEAGDRGRQRHGHRQAR